MTMIEKFVDFVQTLPADSAQSVEATLAQIMESYSGKYELTPEQLAEMQKRMAEDAPEFASPEAISAIFGKSFSA
ncbi:hypothetical protein [Parasphingorhabdus sp.]|jgi:hypothetical protein|uniref:hypothetical protein n=1 Tax=Parasphingorhabdus sp. TaxID=2709688 RepID=UPI003D2A8997